jgi:23S rRNA pseudouridine2605 synthase
MLDAAGHPVRRLVRTRIGPIADPGLAPGSWRPLAYEEIRSLYAASEPQGLR